MNDRRITETEKETACKAINTLCSISASHSDTLAAQINLGAFIAFKYGKLKDGKYVSNDWGRILKYCNIIKQAKQKHGSEWRSFLRSKLDGLSDTDKESASKLLNFLTNPEKSIKISK